MPKPAKIRRVQVIIPEEKTNELIISLHETGICELKKTETDLEIKDKFVHEDLKELDDTQSRLNNLLGILDNYKEAPQVDSMIKSLFSPKKPKRVKVDARNIDALLNDAIKNLDHLEAKILPESNKLQKIKEEIREAEFKIESLSILPNIETRIFEPTQNIKSMVGVMTKGNFEEVKKELEKKTVFVVKEEKKDLLLIAVFPLNEDSPSTERLLHENGFDTIKIPFENKKPKDIISKLKADVINYGKEIRVIEEKLRVSWKQHTEKLKIAEEELEICKDRFDALKNIRATKAFTALEAWVPEKNFKKFNIVLQETSPFYYMETEESEDAPSLLENNKWVAPFEGILKMYAIPKYNHFDPTIIIAISFPVFFGFMLTDVAYGLMFLAMALVMYFRAGKYDESIKSMGIIFLFFGISTVLFGALFGSYFGDFFLKIGIVLPMPIDPMKDVMLGIGLAVAIGLLHITLGLVVGFVEAIKKKDIMGALMNQGVWLIFVLSVLCFVLPLGVAFMKTLGFLLLFASIGMQLVLNFIKNGFVPAILSVFGFTGFLGDTFSYARLMALGIGTAGIALAVNFMVILSADMIPVVGIVFAAIIFLIGHLFNLAMNGLGGFVHSLRLHFLEFFSKFYDGGGREYKPFCAFRKITYTEVKKWQ